jgi:hypothetical protein
MEDHLTRQEVAALIDAQAKVAVQLTIIAERLGTINGCQEKIVAELSNGMPKRISEPLVTHAQSAESKLDELLRVHHEVKWVVRSVGIIIGLFGLKALAQIAVAVATGHP